MLGEFPGNHCLAKLAVALHVYPVHLSNIERLPGWVSVLRLGKNRSQEALGYFLSLRGHAIDTRYVET